MRKRLSALLSALLLAASAVLPAAASTPDAETAREITSAAAPRADGGLDLRRSLDRREASFTELPPGGTVTLEHPGGIGGLYLLFDAPCAWRTSGAENEPLASGGGFLHEFVPLPAAPGALSLTFPDGASLSELYVFSAGSPPDWVQRWEPPCERADLLLLSAHADDEHLFFAGLLPLYAGERELAVQVVYFTDSADTHVRHHELLNGLWTAGVRSYPVIAPFPDLYSTSLSAALAVYGDAGYTEEDFIGFVTEQLRRFRPLVAVGHDRAGEYSHGTHILSAHALERAVAAAGDPAAFPESAARYGTHETPKLYLHLAAEGAITLDLDLPLARFGGQTAFAVSQCAFAHHASQFWTGMDEWIGGTPEEPITRATQIEYSNPRLYGLVHSTVGADSGSDLLENIVPYAEQARLSAESERLESERLESKRIESERIESERLESERLAAQTAPPETEPPARTTPGGRRWIVPAVASGGLLLLVLSALLARAARTGKKKGKKKS